MTDDRGVIDVCAMNMDGFTWTMYISDAFKLYTPLLHFIENKTKTLKHYKKPNNISLENNEIQSDCC